MFINTQPKENIKKKIIFLYQKKGLFKAIFLKSEIYKLLCSKNLLLLTEKVTFWEDLPPSWPRSSLMDKESLLLELNLYWNPDLYSETRSNSKSTSTWPHPTTPENGLFTTEAQPEYSGRPSEEWFPIKPPEELLPLVYHRYFFKKNFHKWKIYPHLNKPLYKNKESLKIQKKK